MEQKKLKQLILKILKQDDRIWNEYKKDLNQSLLFDLVERIDEKIINLLFQEKKLRDRFFVKIKDVYVFKTDDFRFFIEENKLDNSYTQYKNRIGLTDGKRFLKDTNDVVLVWPYKDCVLEGGQSTEEGIDTYFEYSYETKTYEEKKAKRKEIFFNSVLAYDEIDRLFDHKAFVNWKRFTKDGEQDVKEIKRDKDGTIKENLIIKGNNLLVLHSLKKQFAGKVKLIYIDPPYNTGNDGFKYNDNFNHSTWLTFMKNRLEVAKELLRDDGVIFVQCDDNEQAYLKVLMDEVFERDNFINHISVRVKSSAGFKTVNKGLMETSEYIFIFAKNKKNAEIKTLYKVTGYDNNYNLVVVNPLDNYKKWKFAKIDDFCFSEVNLEQFPKSLIEVIKFHLRAEYAYKNSDKVFRYTAINDDAGKETLEAKEKSLYINEVFEVRTSKGIRYIHKGQQITFFNTKLKTVDGKLVPTQQLTNIWEDISWEGIANEGNVKLKKGKKPEKLLQRIIEMGTEKGDIVLDYHLGSGTTCAVAHKMGRQYIGIEQLDYKENDSVIRLQNVVNGDQSGISQSIIWQGGGDFIYCELAKWNETAKEKILACESLEELETFFDEMYEKYFLNYNLKIKDFKEKVLKEEEFRNLLLDEQKKIFIAILDNNQMYINKSEMADKKFGISNKDQNLTNEFYKS